MSTGIPCDLTYLHRVDLAAIRDTLERPAPSPTDLDTAAAKLERVLFTSAHIRAYFARDVATVRDVLADPKRVDADIMEAVWTINRIFDETCVHRPEQWRAIDAGAGLVMVTCPGCQASWISDGVDVPAVAVTGSPA